MQNSLRRKKEEEEEHDSDAFLLYGLFRRIRHRSCWFSVEIRRWNNPFLHYGRIQFVKSNLCQPASPVVRSSLHKRNVIACHTVGPCILFLSTRVKWYTYKILYPLELSRNLQISRSLFNSLAVSDVNSRGQSHVMVERFHVQGQNLSCLNYSTRVLETVELLYFYFFPSPTTGAYCWVFILVFSPTTNERQEQRKTRPKAYRTLFLCHSNKPKSFINYHANDRFGSPLNP